jgi:hypothetical protein
MAIGDKIPLKLPTLEFSKKTIQDSMLAIHSAINSLNSSYESDSATIHQLVDFRSRIVPGSLAIINAHRYRNGLIAAINDDYHSTFPAHPEWDIKDAMAAWETTVANIMIWLNTNNPAISVDQPKLTKAALSTLKPLLTAYFDSVDLTDYTFD